MPSKSCEHTAYASRLYSKSTSQLSSRSAWWGFASATDHQRVEAFLRRGARSGLYPPQLYTADEITDSADEKLFDCILRNNDHVLHELLS